MIGRRILAAAAVLAVAGCSSTPNDRIPGTGGVHATIDKPSASAVAASSSPAALPPAPKITTHPFGESVPLAAVAVATVYGYQQPVADGATRPDQAGFTWGAADVKVCAGDSGIVISHDPWALVYDDATIIEPSHIGYRQFPQPEYPWGDRTLAVGRCVRGWITGSGPLLLIADRRLVNHVFSEAADLDKYPNAVVTELAPVLETRPSEGQDQPDQNGICMVEPTSTYPRIPRRLVDRHQTINKSGPEPDYLPGARW